MTDSTLPPELIRAYRETHYRVPSLALTLRIDEPNLTLALAQRQHGGSCSAFITACNPCSAALSAAKSASRQQALAADLGSSQFSFVYGIGQHTSNGWAGEPSYLVFGLTLPAVLALRARWEQNGLVWSAADAIPRLILLK